MLMLVMLWNCLGAGTGLWGTLGDREPLLMDWKLSNVTILMKIYPLPEGCGGQHASLHE